ncbi:DgyrCDS10831 [Dimorphilus gyrociliatus]|uniref:DgyrCDS10831 n=1 Tax=Dimorphilus gyrociliatus TaxID=2664684 RepID=A0A7I8W2I9_9ANNE|nr:DgyrCDS10831 [Dimorphilus gyrociliatus]
MANDEDLSSEQTDKLVQFQDITGIEDMERCREVLQDNDWNLERAVQRHLGDTTSDTTERFYPEPTLEINPEVRLLRPDVRRAVTDADGDVRRFIREFDEKYGENHPSFYSSSYSSAIRSAKQNLQFLIVYLHSDKHSDTDSFCSDVICSETIRTWFQRRNAMFWGCSVELPEGHRVSGILRENVYPFLAVIVLKENKMMVVGRMEGFCSADVLVERLDTVVESNEASLIAEMAARQERARAADLREQQDEAYLATLRADQEKERLKRQEQEQEERLRNEQAEKEMQLVNRKKKAEESLSPEPTNSEDSIKVILKLPEGPRIERKFDKKHNLSELHDFVLSRNDMPDSFELLTNFPTKVILRSENAENCNEYERLKSITFEEAQITGTTLLFVRDLDA